MLELVLTRYLDRRLVGQLGDLRFLVLDELHTYRGRQGADVALLVRRLREASGSDDLRCVGTSATLSTEGSHADRQAKVADVASLLFGDEVRRRRRHQRDAPASHHRRRHHRPRVRVGPR